MAENVEGWGVFASAMHAKRTNVPSIPPVRPTLVRVIGHLITYDARRGSRDPPGMPHGRGDEWHPRRITTTPANLERTRTVVLALAWDATHLPPRVASQTDCTSTTACVLAKQTRPCL